MRTKWVCKDCDDTICKYSINDDKGAAPEFCPQYRRKCNWKIKE